MEELEKFAIEKGFNHDCIVIPTNIDPSFKGEVEATKFTQFIYYKESDSLFHQGTHKLLYEENWITEGRILPIYKNGIWAKIKKITNEY